MKQRILFLLLIALAISFCDSFFVTTLNPEYKETNKVVVSLSPIHVNILPDGNAEYFYLIKAKKSTDFFKYLKKENFYSRKNNPIDNIKIYEVISAETLVDGDLYKYRYTINELTGDEASQKSKFTTFLFSFTHKWENDFFDFDISDASGNEKVDPDITACGTLSSSGTYNLVNNVTSSTSCLTLNANDIELDCQGNTITITGQSSGVYAIILNAFNNLSVKNCNINISQPISSAYQSGFRFYAATNVNINNVNVSTNVGRYGTFAYFGATAKNVSIKNSKYYGYNTSGDYFLYLAIQGDNLSIDNINCELKSSLSSSSFINTPSNNTEIKNSFINVTGVSTFLSPSAVANNISFVNNTFLGLGTANTLFSFGYAFTNVLFANNIFNISTLASSSFYFASSTSNVVFTNNSFLNQVKIDDRSTNNYYNTTIGNFYQTFYLYDVNDLDGDYYADSGTQYPFNKINTPLYFITNGEDDRPFVGYPPNPPIFNNPNGSEYVKPNEEIQINWQYGNPTYNKYIDNITLMVYDTNNNFQEYISVPSNATTSITYNVSNLTLGKYYYIKGIEYDSVLQNSTATSGTFKVMSGSFANITSLYVSGTKVLGTDATIFAGLYCSNGISNVSFFVDNGEGYYQETNYVLPEYHEEMVYNHTFTIIDAYPSTVSYYVKLYCIDGAYNTSETQSFSTKATSRRLIGENNLDIIIGFLVFAIILIYGYERIANGIFKSMLSIIIISLPIAILFFIAQSTYSSYKSISDFATTTALILLLMIVIGLQLLVILFILYLIKPLFPQITDVLKDLNPLLFFKNIYDDLEKETKMKK